MTGLPGFTVDIDQNPYLPAGGRDVSAIVTVTADQAGDAPATGPVAGPDGGSAEIIIIDCSGSMDYPPAKLAEARAATAAAVDVISDGTWFAIVAGTSTAWPVYPPDGSMAIASERTRAEAKNALRQLRANGGTAIGQWLRLASQIFQSSPATLRHAILLTDGKNQHETPEELAAAISLCEGRFRCDCRGVGTDWEVGELRKDLHGPARHRRHRGGPGRARRRLRGAGQGGDEQAAARCRAAGVDTAAGLAASSSSRSPRPSTT